MGALDGHAALITGGGSGIGLACARALLRDGSSVTIAGRSRERLDAAADDLRADAPEGATVAVAACDVADEAAVEEAVAIARAATGALQHCVAAAGTGTLAPVVAMTAEHWDSVLDVNLRGAFFTLKHAARAMVDAGGGTWVGLSSIAGHLTHRGMAAYCVSKAGLETLVRNAADELGRAGVRVNAIRPGLVPTELAAALDDDPDVRADYLAQMPLGRVGQVDDIAAAARFLSGPESSWITGVVLNVDGGHHLRRGPDLDRWSAGLYGEGILDGRPS